MKAATVSGPSARISCSELGRAAPGEVQLALARLGVLPIVRAQRVADLRQRQVERLVEQRQAREAAGHQAGAVIAALARDDLLLLGQAAHVVVVPDQLDLGLVGVRAGQAVVDPAHAGRRLLDDAPRKARSQARELWPT